MFAESISNDEITVLPKLRFEGKIFVVRKEAELEARLEELSSDPIIGFDTETKPSFKKGKINSVALLQLSNDSISLLIRLKETGIPPSLVRFLEDEKIIKVGAAIRDDIKSMQKIKRFTPGGFIDLQTTVPEYGIECLSVRKMAAVVLNGKVSKSQQLSNWDAEIYSEAQQQYAATDAWVCRQIYQKLITSKASR